MYWEIVERSVREEILDDKYGCKVVEERLGYGV